MPKIKHMLKCLAGSGPGRLLLRRALRREASLCYITSHTVLIMAVSEQLPEVHSAMLRTSVTCCFFTVHHTGSALVSTSTCISQAGSYRPKSEGEI